jgi:uncharacterized protein (UPF0212 family)
MIAGNNRCPKCNSEMVQGFVIDWNSAGRLVSNWVEGAPEKSFWTGTKVDIEKCIPVGTFRCPGCGFLESYAQPEFAAR